MGFSVQAGKSKPFRGTPVLLTMLVTISLFGALVIQWTKPYPAMENSRNTATGRPRLNFAGAGIYLKTPTPATGVVLRRDFDLWHYEATQSASGLSVDVGYVHGSRADLERFVEMNREKAGELALKGGAVDVSITFRKPVAPAVFRRWALLRQLKTTFAALRLQNEDGPRGTLSIASRPDDPLPQAEIDAVKNELPPVRGVYSTRATVSAERLPDLASDPMVFVTDVTPTLAILDLASSGVPGAQDAKVTVESPFADMEDLGLVP